MVCLLDESKCSAGVVVILVRVGALFPRVVMRSVVSVCACVRVLGGHACESSFILCMFDSRSVVCHVLSVTSPT
jgi:hypothetical protein